jgi:hypothetical protein
MDQLVNSIVLFLEFMILGAAACLIAGTPLVKIIGQSWRGAIDAIMSSDRADSTSWVRRCLECGFLLGLIFVVGVAVNSATYWILQPAHIHVIHAVGANARDPIGARPTIRPDLRFFLRPIDWRLTADQHRIYAEDSRLQMQWMKQDLKANDTALGVLEKQIRLIRGLVLAAPLLGLFGFLSAFRRVHEEWWRFHIDVRPGIGYPIVALLLYLFLMTSYWSLEVSYHRMVWHWPSQSTVAK